MAGPRSVLVGKITKGQAINSCLAIEILLQVYFGSSSILSGEAAMLHGGNLRVVLT